MNIFSCLAECERFVLEANNRYSAFNQNILWVLIQIKYYKFSQFLDVNEVIPVIYEYKGEWIFRMLIN